MLSKKWLLCGLTGFLIIYSCSTSNKAEMGITPENTPTGMALIKMRAAADGPFASIADSAIARVSADDMIALVRQLIVTDSSIEGTITGIPAGEDRTIEIEVYDADGVLQYTGSDRIDVIADTTVHAEITIVRVKGDVAVTGEIVDSTDPLYNKLVAYFPFNGSARDMSGLLNDGVVYGAQPTSDRSGRENGAYYFDGSDDYIEVPYKASLDCEDSISVALWAKSDLMGEEYAEDGTIVQMGVGSEEAYTIKLEPLYDIDAIQFEFRTHWTTPENSSRDALEAAIIDGTVRNYESKLDTSWHFYAFTFDGDSIRAFVDSNMIGSKVALPGSIADYPLRIGAQSKSVSRYWNGKIDDIRIYHRALSSEEIGDIMQLEN